MTGDRTIRLVVVDDEPDILELLRVQFRHTPGFELVGSTDDGEEALRLVESLRPDAVVMDLLMPGMNGFGCIATLQEAHPDIGIVAYTGVAGSFVREEMGRRDIEVVLKSGNVAPLADALRRSVKEPHTD